MPKYIGSLEEFKKQNNKEAETKPETAVKTQMDTINDILDKGIKLLDKITQIKQIREKTQIDANTQIEAKAQKEAEKIINTMPEPTIHVKSHEAKRKLLEFLENLDANKTIKEYKEEEIKKLDEAGMLEGLISEFIASCVELKK